MSHSLIITVICPICGTKRRSPSFLRLISDAPYNFVFILSLLKVPPFLFKRKYTNRVNSYTVSQLRLVHTQKHVKLTIISDAICSLTSSSISFHFLTPISGACFLVYTTTSSTKDRWLPPTGPSNLLENSIFNFVVPCLNLLLDIAKPLRGPLLTVLKYQI